MTYGPAGAFVATCSSCSSPNTQLHCSTAVGFGANHMWTVTIGGQTVVTPSNSSYSPPAISSTLQPTLGFLTSGGSPVTLTGTNFGPLSTSPLWTATGQRVSATFGPAPSFAYYTASACAVTVAHTQMTCTVGVGVGAQIFFLATVAGQQSAVSPAATNYVPPSLTSFLPAAGVWHTAGGQLITLSGSNFGASTVNLTNVTYGPAGQTGKYQAAACNITTPFTTIVCATAQGVGASLLWFATVGLQVGTVSSFSLSYAAPVITGLSGTTSLQTPGGDWFTLTGTDFSASMATVDSVSYAFGANVYTVTSGCVMTVPHTQIACTSLAGECARSVCCLPQPACAC